MKNKKLQQLMACLTMLSSCTACSWAAEKNAQKKIVRSASVPEITSGVKVTLECGLGGGLLIGSYFLRNKLIKSTQNLRSKNLQDEAKLTALKEANSNNENRETLIKANVANIEKQKADTEYKANNRDFGYFNLSGVSDEEKNKLIEKVMLLISDDAAKAYLAGDFDKKKAISTKLADVIEQINKNELEKSIKELQELDKLVENPYLKKEGILKPIMGILSTAEDLLSKLDLVGIEVFGNNTQNAEGLQKYFQGVVDYLIPTEGDGEKLKLAKLIKKVMVILNKHYGKEKTIEKLMEPLVGSEIKSTRFGKIFIEKLEKILKMDVG